MSSKLPYYAILTALLCTAIWGLMRAQDEPKTPILSDTITVTDKAKSPSSYSISTVKETASLVPNSSHHENRTDHRQTINKQLTDGHFRSAANYINEHYSEFSSQQLEQLKTLFLEHNTHPQRRVDRLRAATLVFDDLESWDTLATAALELRQWQTGFNALMRASELENRSPALERKLENLIKVASQLRAGLETRGDQLGIKDLYQQIYDLHPNYPRVQLELAFAQLRLDESAKAERLLSALQYDPELGEIAQQALARSRENNATQEPEQAAEPAPPRNDIVVPLIRAGNSFFIDTAINNHRTRLLLDTGASISALSSNLIKRLDLSPTGQVINLNTANGTRQARLYKTEQLNLGRVRLSGLVIAEIDLENNSGFQGLLGTDALNQIDNGYSYLIDNKQNALIFRRR